MAMPIPAPGQKWPIEEHEANVAYFEKRLPLEPVEHQWALYNLSVSYELIGNGPKAANAAERLLKNLRRYGGLPNAIELREAEYRLGSSLMAKGGDTARALEYLSRAKRGFEDEAARGNTSEYDASLASLIHTMGRAQEALGRVEEAKASFREHERLTGGPDPYDQHLSKGWELFRSGDYAGSQLRGHAALAEAVLKSNGSAMGGAERLIARSLEAQGDLPSAAFWARSALDRVQAQRARIRSRDNRHVYVQQRSELYTLLARLLSAQGRFLEAEQVIKLLKADELEALGVRGATPELAALRTPEQQARNENDKRQQAILSLALELEELQKLKRLGKPKFTPEQEARLDNLDDLCAGWRIAYMEWLSTKLIVLPTPATAPPVTEPLNLQRLANADDGTVAVRYIVDGDLVDILFIVGRATQPIRSQMRAPDLEKQINDWRQAVETGGSTAELAKPLYAVLVEPIEALLKTAKAKTIVLALSGPLRALPFAALQDNSGNFLVTRFAFAVHYDGAPTPAEKQAGTKPWRIAGLGVTEAREYTVGGRSVGFAKLSNVEAELKGLKVLGDAQADTWLDGEFSRRRFRDALLAPYNVVHVASHYRPVLGSEEHSVLLLGTEVISLRDLAAYDYKGLELIAFSACSSGLTSGRTEEGVATEGLGGAVLKSGAKTAIVTLWDISDQSTPRLTAGFYRAMLTSGASRAKSLQEAQLSMLRDTGTDAARNRLPRAWGAFIVMGESR